MKSYKWIIILFLLSSSGFSQSVNLPLDHWGYTFLEKLETKNLFYSHDLRTRPVSRKIIADIISTIDKKVAKEPGLLTSAEKRLFEQLKGDMLDELSHYKDTKAPKQKEKHALVWSESNSGLYVDLYGHESIISNKGQQFDNNELLSETTLGGIIRGHLGHQLGFYVDARNSVTRGGAKVDESDEQFDPSEGSPVVISGQNVFRDRATAYFILENSWIRLQAGRDELNWGPGYHGGLTLTTNMPVADLIKLSTRFKRFKFTSVHTFLQSGIGSKYLSAHRLDFMLSPGIYVGGTETVVYGRRDVEFSYLNPIMPYHVAEHHLGDKDNNALSFDVTITMIPNVKLYAEYFIDDMTSTRSLTTYFGNKFAFLVGGYWVEPLRLSNVDLRFEYTRIEPYVYTHHDSINIYTNYDKVIGYWLGPDSDSAFFEAGYQLGRDLRVEVSLEKTRKGEGRVNTDSRPATGDRKYFLNGVIESKKIIGFRIKNQIRRDIFLSISYSYVDNRNLNNVVGTKSFDNLGRFELSFNY